MSEIFRSISLRFCLEQIISTNFNNFFYGTKIKQAKILEFHQNNRFFNVVFVWFCFLTAFLIFHRLFLLYQIFVYKKRFLSAAIFKTNALISFESYFYTRITFINHDYNFSVPNSRFNYRIGWQWRTI